MMEQPFSLKKKSRGGKDEGLWLLSFADLSMILISFFILMLSFAKVDKKKMEQVVEGMKADQHKNTATADTKLDTVLKIERRLNEVLKKLKLDDTATVTYDITGLSIELKDDLVFESGSAKLKPEARPRILSLMKTFTQSSESYRFRFEGHTDDQSISSGPYASNWELSSARGIALMRTFEELGIAPARMSVMALADTKPKVPVSGLAGVELEKARRLNRRVVIRVE